MERQSFEAYCQELDQWPRVWMITEEDLPPGEQLVALFRPFLEDLTTSDLAPRTIRKHVNNLWILGSEFIRQFQYSPSLRGQSAREVLTSMIGAGGPLLPHMGHEQQRSFDSTCRKLSQFLTV